MKRALILGCSHAAGTEISLEPGLNPDAESQEYGATRSYPVKIAQRLGYQPLNHAISGGSNDAMFRIWHEQKHKLTKDDVVIACWTGYDRSEIWDNEEQRWISFTNSHINYYKMNKSANLLEGTMYGEKIKRANEYANYLKYWAVYECTEPRGHMNKTKNIEALNYQAQRLGIRVINIDSVHPVWDLDKDSSWPVDTTFCQWAEDHNSPKTAWGHYFEATHTAFAEYVVNRI